MNPGATKAFFGSFSVWIVAACLLPVFSFSARAADLNAEFQQANKLYEEGKFPEAIAAYDRMVEKSGVSPGLLFNLGNARLKAGQVGKAIQAYRQAQTLAPRDPDLRANLNFAREQAGNPPPGSRWTRSLEALTLNEWTVLASLTLAIWFLLLALGQWKAELGKALRNCTLAAGLVAITAIVCVGVVLQARYFSKTAVVIAPEAVVRRGPFDESQTAFTARDGTELAVLGRKDDWLEVNDAQNRVGWVRSRQVAPVQ